MVNSMDLFCFLFFLKVGINYYYFSSLIQNYHIMATEQSPSRLPDDGGRAEILSQEIQTLRSAFFRKQNVSQIYLPLAILSSVRVSACLQVQEQYLL